MTSYYLEQDSYGEKWLIEVFDSITRFYMTTPFQQPIPFLSMCSITEYIKKYPESIFTVITLEEFEFFKNNYCICK